VRPVLTVSYCAVFADPPEYPAVALVTPFTCSNTACMPQKHPPANTTVSELLVLLSGSSAAGLGSFTAALEAWHAMVVPRHIIKRAFANRGNIESPIIH
jgi:hypothetical protein